MRFFSNVAAIHGNFSFSKAIKIISLGILRITKIILKYLKRFLNVNFYHLSKSKVTTVSSHVTEGFVSK